MTSPYRIPVPDENGRFKDKHLPERLGKASMDRSYVTADRLPDPRLATFRNALVAGNARILHVGHSITEGTRATAPGQRWTDVLLTALRGKYQPADIAGGFGYIPATVTYPELLPSQWAFTGNAPVGSSGSGLGRYFRELNNGATGTLTFTGTSITVHFTSYSGGPRVSVTIDGKAYPNISANSASSNYANSATFSDLGPGSHTIVLTNIESTGTFIFALQGAMVYSGDESVGVRSWNAGHSGDQIGSYLTGNPAIRVPPVYAAIKPHLVTFEFAVNEYRNNTSATTFGTNLAALIDQVRNAVGTEVSLLVVSDAEPAHPGTPVNPWSDYKQQMVTVAESKGAALVDLATVSGLGLSGSGMDADQTHPNTAGHAAIGTAVADMVTKNVGPGIAREAVGALPKRLSESALNATYGPSDAPLAASGVGWSPLGLADNSQMHNAPAFAQDSVTTHNGVQYAVWSNQNRQPHIAKRVLPGGKWEVFNLATVPGNPLSSPTPFDGHNNYVVGVSPDGYVHVSGNLHGDPLKYIRSQRPGDITSWVTTDTKTNADESKVTYPKFFTVGDEFLRYFRTDYAGDGAEVLDAWNPGTKTWSRRSRYLDGQIEADHESPYSNHIAVRGDTIGIFYVWRADGGVNHTHDVGYIQSTDHGLTWETVDGEPLEAPLTPTTAPVVKSAVWESGVAIINQAGADIDEQGRPHAAWWILESGTLRLLHLWHDGSAWHQDIEDNLGINYSPLQIARPSVFCANGRTFLIYSPSGNVNTSQEWIIKDISVGGVIRLSDAIWSTAYLGHWEPNYDYRALRERGELHMLVTPTKPDGGGVESGTVPGWTSRPIGVVTVDLDRLEMLPKAGNFAVLSSKRGQGSPERMWLPPGVFTLGNGDATLGVTSDTPRWQLTNNSNGIVLTTCVIPPHWRSFRFRAWWTPLTADSPGGAVVQMRYVPLDPAATALKTGEVQIPAVTLTVGSTIGVVTATDFGGEIINSRPTRVMTVAFRRHAPDAADTYTGSLGLLGVEIIRVS